MARTLTLIPLAAATAAVLAACADDGVGGTGDLTLYASGGLAARDGFPHMEGTTEQAFVDGWRLRLDKYLLSFADVKLTDPRSGAVVAEWNEAAVVDLAKGRGTPVAFADIDPLPARRLDFGFRVVPAVEAAAALDVDPADKALMVQKGYTMYLAGTAERDGRTVTLRVGFTRAAEFAQCMNGDDGTRGIAIQNRRTTEAQISVHLVHVFWDSLVPGNERLRFDAWAAVANDDGVVTELDLARQNITALLDERGRPLTGGDGRPLVYNDGGKLDLADLSLRAFAERGARDSLHLNGLGLCRARDL